MFDTNTAVSSNATTIVYEIATITLIVKITMIYPKCFAHVDEVRITFRVQSEMTRNVVTFCGRTRVFKKMYTVVVISGREVIQNELYVIRNRDGIRLCRVHA